MFSLPCSFGFNWTTKKPRFGTERIWLLKLITWTGRARFLAWGKRSDQTSCLSGNEVFPTTESRQRKGRKEMAFFFLPLSYKWQTTRSWIKLFSVPSSDRTFFEWTHAWLFPLTGFSRKSFFFFLTVPFQVFHEKFSPRQDFFEEWNSVMFCLWGNAVFCS